MWGFVDYIGPVYIGFSDSDTPVMKDQMEKIMEHELGSYGLYRDGREASITIHVTVLDSWHTYGVG